MLSLKNLSIRSKVLLIVAAGILFQMIIAATGLYYLNASNQSLTTTVEVETEAIRQSARVRAEFLDMIIFEKNMIIAVDAADKASQMAKFDSSQGDIGTKLNDLVKILDGRGKQHLETFTSEYRAYLSINQRIRELLKSSDEIAATRLSTVIAREHTEKARVALGALMDELDAELHQRKLGNDSAAKMAITLMIAVLLATLVVALGFGLFVTRVITSGLGNMVSVADAIANGKLDNAIDESGRDEVARLAVSVRKMQTALVTARRESEAQDWLKTGIGRLNDVMRGDQDMKSLATKIVTEVTTYLDAKIGAFYLIDEKGAEPSLKMIGSYAYTKRKNLSSSFKLGEGLVGQAALEAKPILIRNVPEDYIRVVSGLGESVPKFICVNPFVYDDKVKGVLEIATLAELTDIELEYLRQSMPAIAITLETAQGREELSHTLQRSQQLAEELQVQQEELKSSNEELEEQTQALQMSEERLKAQQEEMEVVNEELEQKNTLLERQKREVEQARNDIADKAEDLALASKYKSEFLSNMSHELRTPLNSLLILSRVFADNREGNLSDDQIESARVIYNSGTELLGLINDILDLAKIEAGHMDLQVAKVMINDLAAGITESFQHIADNKGLKLDVIMDPLGPSSILTDKKRLNQVVNNLLSNAIKFTEQGVVKIRFAHPASDVRLPEGLPHAEAAVAITIQDTGIGIEKDKQKVIFEAFQQADGGTARKYGGTGLGLSITRELVKLLGGEIRLDSTFGEGSTFTIILPVALNQAVGGQSKAESGAKRSEPKEQQSSRHLVSTQHVADDRENLSNADSVILIVDDDPHFAKILAAQCHEKGLKSLVAHSGEEGLQLAEEHLPKGVILDLKLPGIDGWAVLEMLKGNPKTRHMPVHIMSVEEANIDALKKGAIGFLTKPPDKAELDAAFVRITDTFNKKIKAVLVVEDNAELRQAIVGLIGNEDVITDEAATGKEAISALRAKQYDCVVLDLGLPDMDGTDVLRALEADKNVSIPPIIIHTGRELTHDEEMELRAFSESIIIKDVRSEDRLIDEVSLFLHHVVSQLPERTRKVITDLHDIDVLFKGKKVLIVDDDMRTVFALSKILTAKGVITQKAENGAKALQLLENESDVDLVLMDIMMPVMDGYETMKRIRAQNKHKTLPIIALTAKAMRGDQELCIAAGANDYLTKPLDENRLYSMMRVWLYR